MARPRPSRPESDAAEPRAWVAPRTCLADGGPVDERGWCERGRGYAVACRVERDGESVAVETRCPFVCPFCAGRLEWSGRCDRCRGIERPGAPETYPGDSYLVDETGAWDPDGHYRVQHKGPQPIASPETAEAAFATAAHRLAEAIVRRAASVAQVGKETGDA